jgi:acyl-CoA thioester hydrolase
MTVWRGGKAARTIPDHCFTETLQRVGVAETDMMGIVHHANYVTYFERGRLEYMRRRGFPYKEMVGRGYHMPVVEANLRYRKPANFDDVLRIETRLGALSRVTVRFNYVVRRAPALGSAPELLVEGHIVLACVDDKGRPRPLPADILQALFVPELSQSDDLVIPGSPADRVGNA